jgi:large subunit ribosomal protein MRP49
MRQIELDTTAATLPPIAEHEAVEFSCLPPSGATPSLIIDGRAQEAFLRPGDPHWRWRWNPGTAVGLHEVRLDIGATGAPRHWQLRVEPQKIDQERYAALHADIERAAQQIARSSGGMAREGLEAGDTSSRRSMVEVYELIVAEHLDPLERAIRRIAAQPAGALRPVAESEPLDRYRGAPPGDAARITQGAFDPAPPGVAAELQAQIRPEGGLLPRELPTTGATPQTDTYENRVVRRLLERLERLCTQVAEHSAAAAQSGDRRHAERAAAAVEGAQRTIQRIRALAALPLLRGIGPLTAFHGPTHLMRNHRDYRTVYRAWQALRRRPMISVTTPAASVPITDLPHLYEIWCALRVATALLALNGRVVAQHLVETAYNDDEVDVTVRLREQEPLLSLAHGEKQLTLRYQPRYTPTRSSGFHSLDDQTHIPDLAIEITAEGAEPRVLLLDAKYRLTPDGRSVPRDALADAYTYRGAIGYGGQLATLGAVLLYPGEDAPVRYASGVGVIPLLPGVETHLVNTLYLWLADNTAR